MKLLVLTIAALLVFGAAVANAAVSYWKRHGTTYVCEGVVSYAICSSQPRKPGYTILIDRKHVDVLYDFHADQPRGSVVFQCTIGKGPRSCVDLRP